MTPDELARIATAALQEVREATDQIAALRRRIDELSSEVEQLRQRR